VKLGNLQGDQLRARRSRRPGRSRSIEDNRESHAYLLLLSRYIKAMKLVTVEIDGRARPGVISGDHIVDLGGIAPDMRAVLEKLDQVRPLLKQKGTIALKGAKLLAPIRNPGMVLSVGMNYYEHLKEMKTPVPEKPAAFTKSVASIIGPAEPIRIPPSNPDMLDWKARSPSTWERPATA
jgi:hypothetical protein